MGIVLKALQLDFGRCKPGGQGRGCSEHPTRDGVGDVGNLALELSHARHAVRDLRLGGAEHCPDPATDFLNDRWVPHLALDALEDLGLGNVAIEQRIILVAKTAAEMD
jgi:hypothetical protein